MLLQILLARFFVIRMHPFAPFVKGVSDFFFLIANHGFPPTREEYLVRLRIPAPDTIAWTLQGKLPTLFASACKGPFALERAVMRSGFMVGRDLKLLVNGCLIQ
jgi:hypothetical protein